MKLKTSLYHYQQDVLDVFQKEIDRGDKKIHIVAPPGSGKTIMGLEMISRLGGNHLILVPNIILQYQWKDKIEKFFLEEGESIDEIVSTSINEIKKINIITYQALTSSNKNNDLIFDKIIDKWYLDFKEEFNSKTDFLNYIEVLKDIDVEEYKDKISKYKKKLKTSGEGYVQKILSKKILKYFNDFKSYGIKSIVVDEAHHLTSWWSKVVYYLWNDLGKTNPFIIGLTATPPYDDIDFFILDDDYSALLGEVDYYIPTPAVVKSGRLAPWSDLVYIVEPGDDLKEVLEKTDKRLNVFIKNNSNEIVEYIFSYVEENYKVMMKRSYNRLVNYLKFIRTYSEIDINKYFFDEKVGDEIDLEDIVKTVGKYLSFLEIGGIKDRADTRSAPTSGKCRGESCVHPKINIQNTKKLFYDLGYIWRANNFYKFRTPIENMLIYSKSKINGVRAILDKEIINLGKDLKCAIITDFLEDREGIINCKYILKQLKNYKELNPILVSGQGIWKLGEDGELEEIDTNILEVTNDLGKGNIHLVIGTRGILGEGWDCPKLNTLIDLTGIVAYMSVNQVRGRAIRLDLDNINKVANIYDIVTYSAGYLKQVDLYRLERKHQKFYGVDDSGLVIRGIDHIYPNIKKHISNYKNINENMLKRSSLREYYYKLWGIGGEYKNKEVFGLDLEVNSIGKFIPFVTFRGYDSFSFFKMLGNKQNLEDLNKNAYYYELIYRFLNDFIGDIVKSQKALLSLPNDFTFNIIKGKKGNLKLVSSYFDEIIIKRFILSISEIFSTVVKQKYVLKYPFAYFDGENISLKYVNFGLPDILCRNKKLRLSLYSFLRINSRYKLILLFSGGLFLYLPNIFSKSLRRVFIYKRIFKTGHIDYVYIKGRDTFNNQKYIGKKPFIKAKIEKLWI